MDMSKKSSQSYFVTLDMRGCICHFTKWKIHPFISKVTICHSNICTCIGPYIMYIYNNMVSFLNSHVTHENIICVITYRIKILDGIAKSNM